MNATPREPFDAEEARIARVYGALPQGEPSPALDARILAQARAAVTANAPVKRRRTWFLGAGLGTAAAAVFAAGVAWQLGVFKPDHELSSVPAQKPAMQEEVDRVDIEFVKKERRREEAAAKPPVVLRPQPAAAAREQAKDSGFDENKRDAQPFPTEAQAPPVVLDDPAPMSIAVPPPEPAPPAPPAPASISLPSAPPPPPPAPAPATIPLPSAPPADTAASMPEPVLQEAAPEPRQDAAASKLSAAAESSDAMPQTVDATPEPDVAASMQYNQDMRGLEDAGTLGGVAADAEGEAVSLSREERRNRLGIAADPRTESAPAVSGAAAPGGRAASNAAMPSDDFARDARFAKQAGLPPWAEDVALAPEPWLERIRDRVRAGDRQGAEHSLRRFVLAHPDRRVPRDLQRLLAE